MVLEIGLQAGYDCPMAEGLGYGSGYGMMGYGGFPWIWLLSLVLVGGIAVFTTYLLLKGKDQQTQPTTHKHRTRKG